MPKCPKFKCDILSTFQTLCSGWKINENVSFCKIIKEDFAFIRAYAQKRRALKKACAYKRSALKKADVDKGVRSKRRTLIKAGAHKSGRLKKAGA